MGVFIPDDAPADSPDERKLRKLKATDAPEDRSLTPGLAVDEIATSSTPGESVCGVEETVAPFVRKGPKEAQARRREISEMIPGLTVSERTKMHRKAPEDPKWHPPGS